MTEDSSGESQTHRPYYPGTHTEPRHLQIGSADPVVRWGRPQSSVRLTEKHRWTLRGRRDGMWGKLLWVTRETSFVAGDGRGGAV